MISLALRSLRGTSLAIVASALASHAYGAHLHVDADAPPGGDVSVAAPFSTLSEASGAAAPGDTIRLRGVFRGQTLTLSNADGLTITKWPGEPGRPLVRGDIPVPPTSWSFEPGSGAWAAPTTTTPLRVVWNWDRNIDAHGRNFGFLRRAGSVGDLDPGEWHFDGSLLRIVPPPGADPDPRSGVDEYAFIRAGNAFRLLGGSGLTVRDVDFALWAYSNEIESGYAIRMESVTDSLIEDCSFRDCGKHAAGFVAGASANNTIRRVFSAGLDHGALPSAGHLVFFSFGTDIDGCVAEDCELLLYNSLDWSGQPIGGACNGVFTHAFGIARVRDVVFRRIRCVEFPGTLESAFGLGEYTSLPADRASMNPADYPVRFIECELVNGGRMFFAGGAGAQAAAFERCRFDFSRAGELGQPWVFRIQGTDARALFVSCVITANGSAVVGSEARLFDVPPESTLLLDGCVVHVGGGLGQNCAHFRQNLFANPAGYPNSLIVARNTVFSRQTPGCLHKGNNIMSEANLPASLVLQDCWYWNIAADQFSLGNPLVRQLASWRSLLDPQGVFSIDPGFQDAAAGDFEGAPGGALRTTTRWSQAARKLGINRRPYSGHFGAYQHGPAGDVDDDGVVSGADLAMLLGAWGPCPSGASPCREDVTGDGAVDAADLAQLLGSWGAPPR